MRILFLSHHPHHAHLAFAHSINATVKIIPFCWLVRLIKQYSFLNIVYPAVTFFYGWFLSSDFDIVAVDGGSSLYAAAAIKKRNPRVKMVFIDADLLFYHLRTVDTVFGTIAIQSIDAVLSVSRKQVSYLRQFTKVPFRLFTPFGKNWRKRKVPRKLEALCVSRIDPEKNVEQTIQHVVQSNLITKLYIAGEGIDKKRLERLYSHEKKVVFLSQPVNLSYYYSRCSFLIHLPPYDPYPVVISEAIKAGCIPIVSEGVGSASLLPKSWIMKQSSDFNEFTKKLEFHIKSLNKSRSVLKNVAGTIPSDATLISLFNQSFYDLVKSL